MLTNFKQVFSNLGDLWGDTKLVLADGSSKFKHVCRTIGIDGMCTSWLNCNSDPSLVEPLQIQRDFLKSFSKLGEHCKSLAFHVGSRLL